MFSCGQELRPNPGPRSEDSWSQCLTVRANKTAALSQRMPSTTVGGGFSAGSFAHARLGSGPWTPAGAWERPLHWCAQTPPYLSCTLLFTWLFFHLPSKHPGSSYHEPGTVLSIGHVAWSRTQPCFSSITPAQAPDDKQNSYKLWWVLSRKEQTKRRK